MMPVEGKGASGDALLWSKEYAGAAKAYLSELLVAAGQPHPCHRWMAARLRERLAAGTADGPGEAHHVAALPDK